MDHLKINVTAKEDWQITLCVITEQKSHGGHCILLVNVMSIGVNGSC